MEKLKLSPDKELEFYNLEPESVTPAEANEIILVDIPNQIICLENCRLTWPEGLKGDYVRGEVYRDLQLIVFYPTLFRKQFAE